MSVSMWSYRPEVCDGGGCPGDCDLCDKPKNMEDEDETSRYIDADKLKAHYAWWQNEDKETFDEIVDAQPTADVRENVKAKIIDNGGVYQCSNCKAILSSEINYVIKGYKPISYCPNCGADMRGGNDEEQNQ